MATKQVRRDAEKTNSARQLEKERLAIRNLLTKGEAEHWQIGVHYNRIVNDHLAEKSNYKSPRAFFAKYFADVPQSTLTLYSLIARTFTESVAKN